jgi:intracellular multiplication protein IcmE
VVRGEDIDEFLNELQAMPKMPSSDEAQLQQPTAAQAAMKELSDSALRVQRRIRGVGGVLKVLPPNVEFLMLQRSDAVAVKRAGFGASDVRTYGKSARCMLDEGWTLSDLIAAGFDAAELLEAGCSAAELRQAGLLAAQLKAAGCSAQVLKGAGFTARELRAADFDLTALVVSGYSASELESAGFVGVRRGLDSKTELKLN